MQWGDAILGRLSVFGDHGDTYSDEPGALLGTVDRVSPLTHITTSPHHDEVRYEAAFENNDITIKAAVKIRLTDGDIPRWTIDLDSTGVDFRVDFVCETAVSGRIIAGMPFDTVVRQASDTNLLPRTIKDESAKIFMGQRELNEVRSFPFQEFVGISNGQQTSAIFAKGVNAYQADDDGTIQITLRRSSEWLAKTGLNNRIGDAGPFFYVPDARCERVTTIELGALSGRLANTIPRFPGA